MKLKVREELCSGCRVCLVTCTLENFRHVQPAKALLKVAGKFPDPGHYELNYCNECGECAASCPEEAISAQDGVYKINQEDCIQCLICVDECPRGVMVVDDEGFPAKCTDCGQCAKMCPREAISKED